MIRRQLPYPYLLFGLLLTVSIQAEAADLLPAQRVRDPLLQRTVLMPIHVSANALITTLLPTHTTRRSIRAGASPRIARAANDRRVRNDIDGDGRTDLLWDRRFCRPCTMHLSSEFAYWTMNGGTITGTATFWYDRNYILKASGDFDGDGRTDLLWMRPDSSSGAFIDHYYIWHSRGDGGFDGQYLASLPSYEYDKGEVGTVADIDGDGKDDLIFRTAITNQGYFMRYWLMDGVSIKRIGNTYAIAPDFRLTGIEDFDGDGRGDILWTRLTTGDMHLWRGRPDGHFEDGVYIGSGNAPPTLG